MDLDALSGSIIFAIAVFLVVVFIIMSVVLQHHWTKYGYDQSAVSIAKKIYYIGGVILLGIILFSALFFTIQ